MLTHTKSYLMGVPIISLSVFKFLTGFVLLTAQLYIYCYSLNYIETTVRKRLWIKYFCCEQIDIWFVLRCQKSTVSFGLYSSDWTAMDIKFKKTMCLAMSINSAHSRVMKVAPSSIINLEMFSRVIIRVFNRSIFAVACLVWPK